LVQPGDDGVTALRDSLEVILSGPSPPKWRLIVEHRPFSRADFPEYARSGAFRTAIYRFNKKYSQKAIIRLFTSGEGYYAIRGSGLESRPVTPAPIAGTPHELTLVETLLFLGEQVRGVHDIDLLFACPVLYESLPVVPDPSNLDKRLSTMSFGRGRKVAVVAHRTGTVSVRVKCSEEPFPRDNLTELLLVLEETGRRLISDYLNDVKALPSPGDWTVKVWHYNRDAFEIAGPDVEMTFRNLSDVLYRYYKRSDGRYRLETIENVGRTIRDLVRESSRAKSPAVQEGRDP
jgi:hypothetical protein